MKNEGEKEGEGWVERRQLIIAVLKHEVWEYSQEKHR